MATIYTNNSSRRVGEDSARIETQWFERLGPPRGAVCNVCGNKSSDGKLVNGRCRNCRGYHPNQIDEKYVKILIQHGTNQISDFAIAKQNIQENAESSGSYQNDY